MRIGRENDSTGPAGVSRVVVNSVSDGFWPNVPMMALSQSVARSAGLVGFSAASL